MSNLAQKLKFKKIAVLMGGISKERDVSLRSGTKVFKSLKTQGFNVVAIDTKYDFPAALKKQKIDVAFIALHGKGGEDGVIQKLLESLNIPYTGSEVRASAVAMDKIAAKNIFTASGIPTPDYLVVNPDNIHGSIDKLKKFFTLPVVIKPRSEGSSIGVSIVGDELKLEYSLREAIRQFKQVFIEEFVEGTEVTVGIIGCGKKTRALPILELIPKNKFYDYEAKYTSGMVNFVLPARLPEKTYKETQKIALKAHRALGCKGVSRIDMLVSKDQIPYVIDVNTIPGMTDQSDLPAEALHEGIAYGQLVLEILESALQ